MNSIIICFLLIFAYSISIGQAQMIDIVKSKIEYYNIKGWTNFTGSSKLNCFSIENNLELLKGEVLGQTYRTLVWKGIYNDNKNVAVKIFLNETCFHREVDILKALNAMNNPKIEEHGVPNVFYHGKFLRMYYAIVMTLFDETLDDFRNHYVSQKKHLSELNILLIFKDAIEALEYLNTKKIIHNDIKPANLFCRDAKTFIADFDFASFKDEDVELCMMNAFASSNFFAKKPRHQIDDLESLVFSLWYVARLPGNETEGKVLNECKVNGTAEAKMKEKCKHFEDENVRKVFELVAADEMLINKKVPDFERIITALNDAIDIISKNSGTADPITNP